LSAGPPERLARAQTRAILLTIKKLIQKSDPSLQARAGWSPVGTFPLGSAGSVVTGRTEAFCGVQN